MKARKLLSVVLDSILVLTISSQSPADTILDDFQVNIEPPGHPPQNSPYSVADWATETIYTAWLSLRDGTNRDVGLQLFDYDLQTLGEASYLNVREGNYDCQRPRLVVSDQGVGAAWIEERTPNRILFRSLDAAGNPLSPPVRVEDNYENVARDSLSIAALEDGYVLVWYDERDSSAIYAQIVDFDGNLIGANFPIRPDSIGSIIALEAQNHPDGRVLVSWVTEGQYSRGRWMDAEGNFMGEVFDMAEGYTETEVFKSMVRFGNDGTGILYQYMSNFNVIEAPIFITYINSQGIQTSPATLWDYWYKWEYQGPIEIRKTLTFPDLISLGEGNFLSTYHYYCSYDPMGQDPWYHSYNVVFSSIDSIVAIPWGQSYDYDLCLLNSSTALYAYDIFSLPPAGYAGYIGLRSYEVSTLDSSESITWLYESDFGAGQDKPDVCVHEDGDFRVVYTNHLSPGPFIYTRYFDENGVAPLPDTLASMNGDLLPMPSTQGRISTTSGDTSLIIWQDGDIIGTLFNRADWCGIADTFNISKQIDLMPNFDINDNNEVMFIYNYRYSDWEWSWGQLYCQAFESIFGTRYDNVSIGLERNDETGPTNEFDVGLRNNGDFLACWTSMDNPVDYGQIFIQPGNDYNQCSADSFQISADSSGDYCSAPALEKSDTGYWITWIQWGSGNPHCVFIQEIDIDGNQIGFPLLISEEEADPTGDPDLAISETGNFAVVWQDARFDEGDLFCRQFNPDGSTFGREYRVNSDPVGPLQCEPAVAFGPEDRLYFTWTDFRNQGGQGDIYCKIIEWDDALSVQEEPEPIPYKFALYPPSPNPFNAVTKITFELPARSQVTLDVFDVAGRIARAHSRAPLQNQWLDAGIHHVLFDGSGLASGVYIARLQAGNQATCRKMVLMK